MLDCKEGFLKGDVVVLGQDTGWKVVMEEIMEVGKHFILYKVKEVGLIPMGDVRITQLVTPLKSHSSVSPSSFSVPHHHGILPLLLSILSHLWEDR